MKTSLSIYRYRYFKKGLIYQLSIYQTPQDTIPRKNDYVIYEPPLINMIRHFCWGFLVKSVCPGSLSWMTLFLFNVKIFWQTWMTGPDNYYRKKTHNFWDGDFLSLKVFAPASPEQIDPLFFSSENDCWAFLVKSVCTGLLQDPSAEWLFSSLMWKYFGKVGWQASSFLILPINLEKIAQNCLSVCPSFSWADWPCFFNCENISKKDSKVPVRNRSDYPPAK